MYDCFESKYSNPMIFTLIKRSVQKDLAHQRAGKYEICRLGSNGDIIIVNNEVKIVKINRIGNAIIH